MKCECGHLKANHEDDGTGACVQVCPCRKFARRKGPRTARYAGRDWPWSQRPQENAIQKNCVVVLKLAGFSVGSTSQYRASHIVVGMADLHLFHEPLEFSGWWETKRPGDDLRPDQVTWRRQCLTTRTLHGWGTDEDLQPWLAELGIAHVTGGVFGLLQRSKWPPIDSMPARIAAASNLHRPAD